LQIGGSNRFLPPIFAIKPPIFRLKIYGDYESGSLVKFCEKRKIKPICHEITRKTPRAFFAEQMAEKWPY
jgi:hypothetical protein